MIKSVKVKPLMAAETLEVEGDSGLQFAVTYNNRVIALFKSIYWAENFVENSTNLHLVIREVVEEGS